MRGTGTCGTRGEKSWQQGVEEGAAGDEVSVLEADGVHAGTDAELAVGLASYVLVEYVADVFPDEAQGAEELVAAAQGGFVVYADAGDDEVRACVVECGEADAVGLEVLVSGVFEVVLVVGVVDDALQVTFVVAYLECLLVHIGLSLSFVCVLSCKVNALLQKVPVNGELMDYFSYFCVRELVCRIMEQVHHRHCIMRALAGMPLGVLYVVSDVAFFVLYYVVRYRRRVVRRNLERVFGELPRCEIVRIEKGFYHSICDVFIEVFKTLNISDEELRERIEVRNCELPERIAEEGKNSLMLLGHCGCWEWCQEICVRYRLPKRGGELYKRLSSEYFGSLMHEIRCHWDTEQVEMNRAARTVLQWSREGVPFLMGFICDQRPDSAPKGRTVFLGQETKFVPGAEEIGRKIGAELIYLDVERTGRGHYRLTFREIDVTDELRGEKYPLTLRFWQLLEVTIRRQPEIWLWSHKRWK